MIEDLKSYSKNFPQRKDRQMVKSKKMGNFKAVNLLDSWAILDRTSTLIIANFYSNKILCQKATKALNKK